MIKGVCLRVFWKLIVHWSKQTQTYKINEWAGLCKPLYTVVLKSKLFLVAAVCTITHKGSTTSNSSALYFLCAVHSHYTLPFTHLSFFHCMLSLPLQFHGSKCTWCILHYVHCTPYIAQDRQKPRVYTANCSSLWTPNTIASVHSHSITLLKY